MEICLHYTAVGRIYRPCTDPLRSSVCSRTPHTLPLLTRVLAEAAQQSLEMNGFEHLQLAAGPNSFSSLVLATAHIPT